MRPDPRAALARLQDAAGSGRLDDLCNRHAVALLVAFGSATDPTADDVGDLDLAVEFGPGAPGDPLDLLNGLMELADIEAIDLMDLRRAGPVARERALVGCVPLFERERGDFARRQMAAILERIDTAWLRRLDLEAMSG